MAGLQFKMPLNEEELLSGDCGGNVVDRILSVPEVCKELKAAQCAFRDMGSVFIIDEFNTYYSVVHLYAQLPRVVVHQAYEDLRKSLASLPNILNLHLEQAGDEDISDEIKQEFQNIINMTVYLYVALFTCLEKSKNDMDSLLNASRKGGRAKKKKDGMDVDVQLHVKWVQAVKVLISLMRLDLQKFWDTAGVDDALVNKVLELVFAMLEEARIKHEKETQSAIWTLLGLLLIYYNADDIILIRLSRFVKDYEYSVQILADGVTHIVTVFGAKSFLGKFTRELIEWQVQETNVESNATKFCTRMVIEMAVQLPMLMEEHLDYINQYLRADNYQLRLMVLGVQVAIMQEGLQRMGSMVDDEVEKWRVLRNHILNGMLVLTQDKVSFVRARIFTFMEGLIRTGQVPSHFVSKFLEKAVLHLRDLSCPVRKSSAACITTILKFNLFGPKLSFAKISKDCVDRHQELMALKCKLFNVDPEQQKQIEQEWLMHVPGLKAELMNMVMANPDEACGESVESEDSEEPDTESSNSQPSQEEGPPQDVADAEVAKAPPEADSNLPLPQQIRNAIHTKDYKRAVKLCHDAADTSETMLALRARMGGVSNTIYYVMFLRITFSNVNVVQPPPDQLQALTQLEESVEYLSDAVKFIQMINRAMKAMCELLNSVNISDMHEAVEFVITAKCFHLDDASDGINALLKVMLRIEEDRRKIAGQALRSVFLTTDSKQLIDHTTQVAENLIAQYQNVSAACKDALERLIITWAADGTLSNDVIETLWSFFLLRVPTSVKNSRAALGLLRMATKGRHTIISRNYRLVATVCFGDRALSDPLLLVEGLEMLYTLSYAPFSADSSEPAFRVAASDPMWADMRQLLRHFRDKRSPIVHSVIAGTVRLIFAVHAQPLKGIEFLVEAARPRRDPSQKLRKSALVAYNVLVGEIAEATLRYLDTNVFMEMKRRQNAKEAKSHEKKKKRRGSKKDESMNNSSALRQTRHNSLLNSTVQSLAEDNGEMQGAEAADEDADYIAEVLEQSLNPNTTLGRLYKRVLWACQSPASANDELVQVSAAGALARGMLVSTTFCKKHVQLLFVMLLRTKFVQVKITILVHMVDLLDRCPNVIEPYTPMLYSLLDDKHVQTRRVALNTLGMLILKDMIRPQGDIWKLAVCIVDSEVAIRDAARSFFLQSTDKSNNLHNYLPDIFTHICERYPLGAVAADAAVENAENIAPNMANLSISDGDIAPPADKKEDKFKVIAGYLFSLVDKAKHIESLVERFCIKFDNADDDTAKRIAYVLSLMTYHDRALQKLIENFPRYKHFILIDEVYSWMGAIISGVKNKALKGLAKELEDLMTEMFKVDGHTPRNVFKKDTVVKKKKKPSKSSGKGDGKRHRRKSKKSD